MANENIFWAVKKLSYSNSNWIGTTQDLMYDLVENIERHLDNVEYVIKNVEKSGCDVTDLQNIYSTRLDVYEAIIDLMSKINEGSTKEIEIEKKMYEKENDFTGGSMSGTDTDGMWFQERRQDLYGRLRCRVSPLRIYG